MLKALRANAGDRLVPVDELARLLRRWRASQAVEGPLERAWRKRKDGEPLTVSERKALANYAWRRRRRPMRRG